MDPAVQQAIDNAVAAATDPVTLQARIDNAVHIAVAAAAAAGAGPPPAAAVAAFSSSPAQATAGLIDYTTSGV